MFWLCLRFPRLALEVAGAADASAASSAFAVIEGPLQQRRVRLASDAAARAGVRAGQPLATAQMLCPTLRFAARDEAAERQALESLAAHAYRFSAEIVVCADAILLEGGRSLALFGGWPALQRRLRCELDACGFDYVLAAAPNASAARVLSLQADGLAITRASLLPVALGAVPLARSGLDAGVVAALHGMGFRNLRDLFRLPRAELARRVGEDTLVRLDRMRGLVAETWPRWQPPGRFERRIEFAFGVESQGALAFPLQRLVRELAQFLAARDGGVQRFSLVLEHERGARTRIEVGLLAPQRDAASLVELARARLERVELPAPVHALGLLADDLPPLCPLHRDLFDPARREQLGWPALAERLRARLGDEALHGLADAPDHRPGRAWRFIDALEAEHPPRTTRGGRAQARAPADSPAPAPSAKAPLTPARVGGMAPAALPVPEQNPGTDDPALRPFWLLRRPILLRDASVRIVAGPERIESGWWDARDQRRDYYVVETSRGQRAWVFVEAGTPPPRGDVRTGMPQWTLHGWFA